MASIASPISLPTAKPRDRASAVIARRLLDPARSHRASKAVFDLCLLTGLFVYVGFPLSLKVLSARAKRNGRHLATDASVVGVPRARVTVVIPAKDEALHIGTKVDDTFANGYSTDLLDVLVVDDGSSDETGAIAARHGARVVRNEVGLGKCGAINMGVAAAGDDTDLIVITDANGMLSQGSITLVADALADPDVALVSGAKDPVGDGAHGMGERIYWLLETGVRQDLGAMGCLDSADGSIYGFRKSWFEPIPDDIINDDFYLAIKALDGGHKVGHAEGAHATEEVSETASQEFQRRTRCSAGVWQTSGRFVHLAHPRHGRVAYAFIGHRLLRSIIMPCLLPLLLVSSIVLRRDPLAKVVLAGQVFVYGAAGAGALSSHPALGAPFQFGMLNAASLRGGWRVVRRSQQVAWDRIPRGAASVPDEAVP